MPFFQTGAAQLFLHAMLSFWQDGNLRKSSTSARRRADECKDTGNRRSKGMGSPTKPPLIGLMTPTAV